MSSWLTRHERFTSVGSTNDVVAGWLRDGTPEVCLAVADEQTAGRGRNGRTWTAPAGAALLCSLGFRPTYLDPAAQWRLAAISSLAMAEAAERVAALENGTIRLKWPNDLVTTDGEAHVRKLAGVLGETHGAGTDHPRATIGIGVNVDWAPADFPPELAAGMTSLAALAPDAHATTDRLLAAFTTALEPLVVALRAGAFPSDSWRARQLTNGTVVRLERPARAVTVGEIRHLRVGEV